MAQVWPQVVSVAGWPGADARGPGTCCAAWSFKEVESASESRPGKQAGRGPGWKCRVEDLRDRDQEAGSSSPGGGVHRLRTAEHPRAGPGQSRRQGGTWPLASSLIQAENSVTNTTFKGVHASFPLLSAAPTPRSLCPHHQAGPCGPGSALSLKAFDPVAPLHLLLSLHVIRFLSFARPLPGNPDISPKEHVTV